MKPKGFTLIELLVVLTLVAILAVITVPAMMNHTLKARRAVVKSVLMEIGSKQEEWFINHKTYTAELADLGYQSPLQIDENAIAVTSAKGVYAITMVVTSVTYSIFAAPLNRQGNDVCGTLVINNTGAKYASKNGITDSRVCW